MYPATPLISEVDALAKTIRNASPQERLSLQAGFARKLQEIERAGLAVPSRFKNLHELLLEEAIEARFNNVPL